MINVIRGWINGIKKDEDDDDDEEEKNFSLYFDKFSLSPRFLSSKVWLLFLFSCLVLEPREK